MLILDVLSERGELSLSRIAEALNAPKTSVFDILTTMEARRMVRRDTDSGTFSLGLHAIELGYSAVRTFGIRKLVAPVLQALTERLDETVHLTVLDDDEVLCIDCYESTKRLRTYSVIGVRGPLHCTEGVRCIGVPVFDHNGGVAASISVSGPTQRVRSENVPELAGMVMNAAADMSSRLGYRGASGRAAITYG